MSKIKNYLNKHLLGEVIDQPSSRLAFARDASIFRINPEVVVAPRTINDIRKVARFAWQLAEKGHILPITARGAGTDQTGGAIGKGIVINLQAHLNKIIDISKQDKDKFAHVQAGTNFHVLNEVLKREGSFVPSFPSSSQFSTVGGAVANHANGSLAGSYGQFKNEVVRLEVVLANGDVIETGRLSRSELNKKKGLQTLEGEIYRRVDGFVEDYKETIETINDLDNSGYSGIKRVKEKNGSFDLTPLFVGSQGTLGIISEIIVKTTYCSTEESIVVVACQNKKKALALIPEIVKLKPALFEYIDGDNIELAHRQEHQFIFDKIEEEVKTGAVLYVKFDDYSHRLRQWRVRTIEKIAKKQKAMVLTNSEYADEELEAVRDANLTILTPSKKTESAPYLIDGSSIPPEKIKEFLDSLEDLAAKHHIRLAPVVNCLNGVVQARTSLQMQSVGDKQKSFKLINDYYDLITKFKGAFCYASSEGRLKSVVVYERMDEELAKLHREIKEVFDPLGILNPKIKSAIALKDLVVDLNSDYDLANIIQHGLRL